jgi:hypothetical protein
MSKFQTIALVVTLIFWASCANIVPPAGGQKDNISPKLLAILPKDSSLNTRVTKLEMHFDEFVALNNATTEITIAPLLPFPITTEANLKNVVLKIPDSLLKENTTYRISFGKSIQDIHENNPIKGLKYTFSTGIFFDSLRLSGKVINALTGKPEGNASVLLYDGLMSDSCVAQHKPDYLVKTDVDGSFLFDGLPQKPLKIFALSDGNSNMMYDGKNELIAFANDLVIPSTDTKQAIVLKLFSENDSITNPKPDGNIGRNNSLNNKNTDKSFSYKVIADTTDSHKRTQDITAPLFIETNKPVAKTNNQRLALYFDSLGVQVDAMAKIIADTSRNNQLKIETPWNENSVYTLHLLKGFIQDSTGVDANPSKTIFRTKRQEDYAKLTIHLPTKLYSNLFLLQVLRDDASIYLKPVKDTMIVFPLLAPGSYTLRVIEDRNNNQKWDHGLLFQKIQPENVIPYPEKINLKAGWENIIDFEEKK